MTPQPQPDPIWSPLLDQVRADALDCLQSNLAVLADHLHRPGTHLGLGRELTVVREAPGRLRVAHDPAERAEQAGRLLGLAADRHASGLTGPAVRALAGPAAAVYVVADAYDLPWCPYAGRRHMEHSFLLAAAGDDGCTIVDAYYNDTQWGAARPGVWQLSSDDFDACLTGPAAATVFRPAAPAPGLPGPRDVAAQTRQARALAGRYADQIRAACTGPDGFDAYVLDVWLLHRSRRLYHAWLSTAGVPDGGARAERHAARWGRLAAQSYVLSRRLHRGGSLPDSALTDLRTLLDEDVRVAEFYGGPAETVRTALIRTLSTLTGAGEDDIAQAATLRDVPGFNSFKLMDAIDELEEQLGVRLPDDALTAESLRDLGSLTRLFADAAAGAPVVRV